MQPLLLKALHIAADIRIDRLNPFQYQFPQYIFPDIVCAAFAPSALVLGAAIVILLALKALAGGEMKLAAAVCTVDQSCE